MFRIYIKRVVEAKQNQELWEKAKQNQGNPCKLLLHKSKNEIRCSAPLRIYLANCKLSNINLAKLHKLSNTPTTKATEAYTEMLLVLWGFTPDRALTVAPGFEGFRTGFPLNDWPFPGL